MSKFCSSIFFGLACFSTKGDSKKSSDFQTESGSEQSIHRHRRSKVKKSKMAARLGGNNSSSASKPHFDHRNTQDNGKTKALVLNCTFNDLTKNFDVLLSIRAFFDDA